MLQGKVFRQLKDTKANLNIKDRNFIDTIKKGSANKSLTRTETNTLITEILENPGQTAEILQKRGILKSLSEEEVQMCKRFQVECKLQVGLEADSQLLANNLAKKYGGKNIIGTSFNEIRPTQDIVNLDKVNYYADKLLKGQKIEPIRVADVQGKGKFIIEGHHRYIASKQTGVKIDIILEKSGPIGLKDWSEVTWKKYISESQFWGE